jgi:hypothetical protein
MRLKRAVGLDGSAPLTVFPPFVRCKLSPMPKSSPSAAEDC